MGPLRFTHLYFFIGQEYRLKAATFKTLDTLKFKHSIIAEPTQNFSKRFLAGQCELRTNDAIGANQFLQ